MKYIIKWTEQNKSIGKIEWQSNEVDANQILAVLKYVEKKYRLTDVYIEDEMQQTWRKKDFLKMFEKERENPHDIVIYFDGNFNHAKKQAGIGFVMYYRIHNKRFRVRENAIFTNMTSNNEAEYAALYFSLVKLEEYQIQHIPIIIRGDSLVVINQMNGEWPVYEQNFLYWIKKIEEKIKKLGLNAHYENIQRTENKEADQLARLAIEGKEIRAEVEV
ncbi:reverse transcriptase-like protein [Massilibacterium senegalense]|uniref:reverse transcriptase-like protein n=1 Tax=Massilibacterium senegalense TaxID=1632858 RepID=UPI0007859E42|nr:reverse transcriptase-like protein [Massilibacterium senegalense]